MSDGPTKLPEIPSQLGNNPLHQAWGLAWCASMKLIEPEKVDGTSVTIGRRVQFRRKGELRTEEAARTYTAVYKDVHGRWKQDALGTTNRREARRIALEIQQRLELGQAKPKTGSIALADVIGLYIQESEARGLAPKSLCKYKADLAKLEAFANEHRVRTLAEFTQSVFYKFRQHLVNAKHKQGVTYAPKSVEAALTLTKQVIKWAWKQGYISTYALANVTMTTAKARPQACFTTKQLERLLELFHGPDCAAIAVLGYAGLRIGELEQLRWDDVLLDKGELGMFHIRRGGSTDSTKDKDARFIPIHPRVRPMLEALPRTSPLVFPTIRERTLLTRLKRACRTAKFPDPNSFKLHSLRHHFASMCANHNIAWRKALAWMGHSDSNILSLYYSLHDEESEASMKALAQTQQQRDAR